MHHRMRPEEVIWMEIMLKSLAFVQNLKDMGGISFDITNYMGLS